MKYLLLVAVLFVPVLSRAELDWWEPYESLPPYRILGTNGEAFPPVHGTLLPDERVLFMGRIAEKTVAGTFVPPPAFPTQFPTPVEPPPIQLTVHPVPVEIDELYTPDGLWYVEDSLFCSGHTLMSDGTVFVAGGTRLLQYRPLGIAFVLGLPYSTKFDYRTDSWSRVPGYYLGTGETGKREKWYPQVTRLPDDRLLITSGWEYNGAKWNGKTIQPGTFNRSVEIYNPMTNSYELVSSHSQTPQSVWNPDYTHSFVPPFSSSDVLNFGTPGTPVMLNLSGTGSLWTDRMTYRPPTNMSSNYGASSAMLPLRITDNEWNYGNGSVVHVGGGHDSAQETSINVYDPVANRWIHSAEMGVGRHHPSTVILPDGRMLIVAGHFDQEPNHPLIRKAQYLDPRNGFALEDGTFSLGEVRGYHTVTLLMPDGRIMMAGGRIAGEDGPENEKPSLRFLYPEYMWAARPGIVSVPSQVSYDVDFQVEWDQANGPIQEVALIGLGSMTHSFDSNQRYVQMRLNSVNGKTLSIRSPANRYLAQAGHYMLFIVSSSGAPSVGKIIHLR